MRQLPYSSRVTRIGGDGANAWAIHAQAEAAKSRGEDVIVMSVGDPDFDTSANIANAGIDAIRAGDTHYTGTTGRAELRSAIARAHTLRSGQSTTADNVIVLSGAQCALFATAQCLFDPGDEVIVLDPCYVTYEATIGASGARMVRAAPAAGRTFRPDITSIARAISKHTKAIFFASPNNPSGAVYTRRELAAIAQIACDNNLWVIADEVYADLTFDIEHCAIASLPNMSDRTITVSSLSKSHAMTGWRCGWAIAPTALCEHLANLALCMLYGLPGFVQQAAIVALTDGHAEVTRMRDIYRARRDLAIDTLNERLGQEICLRPQAGMFALLDVRGTRMTADAFTHALFAQTGVSVLDAGTFGPSADGFVRISYSLDETSLIEGCNRIGDFYLQNHV